MLKKMILAALASTALAAAAAPIKTAKGEVEIAKVPERIAVYDIGVLDTLVALGLGDKIVGVPVKDFSGPYQTPNAKEVGELKKPDFEALAGVKPDLVIVAQRSAPALDDASQVAQTIDLTLTSDNFYQEGLERTQALGKLFGREAEAEKIVADLNKLRDEVKALSKDKGKVLSIMVNGNKIALYGSDSRANYLKSELGLQLIDAKDQKNDKHGIPVSFEFIAEQNPDWIYALDRLAAIGQEGASAKETLKNKLVEGTTAWQKQQVIYPDATNIYINIGGPTALQKSLSELKEAFSAKP